jgi:ATP-binding cassette subfamily B protein
VTNVLADTIPGIRVVKAFAQEKREAERFPRCQPAQPAGERQAQQDLVAVHAHGVAADRIGLLVVWAFGIWQVSKGSDHGRRADRLPRLHRPLLRPARFDEPHRLGDAEGRLGAKRIFDILDHVSSVPEPANPVHPGQGQGRIECATWASATATAR